ncbi:MAG: hypothetical protein HY614_08000 [Candidatus Rokubacteria bacterium]|nr:hypothetical protein [Candidatus Rokubacteria bacterium]
MAGYVLRLREDRLAAAALYALPALYRVLYVLGGEVAVLSGDDKTLVRADDTWYGAGDCQILAGRGGATLLRFELLPQIAGRGSRRPVEGSGTTGIAVKPLLDQPIALDADQPCLMRCDRVDFAPGGEARPHGHKGGGIRCLIAGQLEVRMGGKPGRVMTAGEAWFESGVEPVHALASKTEPTSFIRVSILPRAILGQSSIVYVDPVDAAVKPRTYRVFVDEPIELDEA